MKASELRIWNFIENTDSQMASYMVVNADVIKQNELKMYASLESIPLTEEWLLKFGFEKTYIGYDEKYPFFEKGLIIIDACDFTIETASGLVIEIKYVHQLQNLYFALTGEELTLKP
jgi:hypothetical protein